VAARCGGVLSLARGAAAAAHAGQCVVQQYARCSTVWAREWGPRRPGARAPQIMYKVFAGQKPPVDRGAMPGGFRDLLESCWENDPAARPSFREILTRLRQLLSEERQRRFALQRAAADAEARTDPTLTLHPRKFTPR